MDTRFFAFVLPGTCVACCVLRVVSCVVISRILNPSIYNGYPLYVDLAEIFCHVFYILRMDYVVHVLVRSRLFILDHFYCNEF